MLTEERRAEFHQQAADHRLKADGSRSDRPVRIIGILLMIGGLAGAFVSYNASLAQSDPLPRSNRMMSCRSATARQVDIVR